MMGMSTVALMAAAFAGTALTAKMPVIGFNAHPVHASAATDSTSLIRGQVSGVSVIAGSAGPEVRIAVDAAVSFNHFTLESPHRVVIDLAGAEVGLRVRNYDGVARGPVRNVRISQFRADTVRLVIDLDSKHTYTVARDGGSVTLSVDAPAAQFASWDMGGRTNAVAAASKTPEMQHGEAAGRLDDAKPEVKHEAKHEAPWLQRRDTKSRTLKRQRPK